MREAVGKSWFWLIRKWVDSPPSQVNACNNKFGTETTQMKWKCLIDGAYGKISKMADIKYLLLTNTW